MKTKEEKNWGAVTLAALAIGFAVGYCTPAPASDDFWANQDRSDRQFDRYKADSDAYADRLDRDERRRERETANLLLCGRAAAPPCAAPTGRITTNGLTAGAG